MVLLSLATATADGRPIVGPVDSIFFRGAFVFGSAPDSIRLPPHPRAAGGRATTHLPGEELSVTVHGRAVPVDVSSGPLRQALLDVYVPRYGESWASSWIPGRSTPASTPRAQDFRRLRAGILPSYGS